MHTEIEQRVAGFVKEQLAEKPGLFLVDVLLKGNHLNQKVMVFIDGDAGVNIDDCALISRKLGQKLEDHEIIKEKYLLEVSSPGLDHPIKLIRQYHKNIGRELIIEMNEGSKIQGLLQAVKSEAMILTANNKEKKIDFKEVKQAKVLVSLK